MQNALNNVIYINLIHILYFEFTGAIFYEYLRISTYTGYVDPIK